MSDETGPRHTYRDMKRIARFTISQADAESFMAMIESLQPLLPFDEAHFEEDHGNGCLIVSIDYTLHAMKAENPKAFQEAAEWLRGLADF